MADLAAIAYTGARPGDALPLLAHRTIRASYVPASAFRSILTVELGRFLQDAGAPGLLSSMGTPAAGASGGLAIDWRAIAAPPPGATLGQAVAVLADRAGDIGARLVAIGVEPAAVSAAAAATARTIAAANVGSQVPTLGATLSKLSGGALDALQSVAGFVILLAVLILVGLYLWTR